MSSRYPRLNSVRTRLFVAIAGLVLLAIAFTSALGIVLTQREVERAALRDVSHQADLLAGRERLALLPFARLDKMRPFLERQGESVAAAPLNAPSAYFTEEQLQLLRDGKGVQGTVDLEGTDYFFAARPVSGKAFVLLRPKHLSEASAEPYLKGLLIAGLIGALLAALAALGLARVISLPVRRVARASRKLAASGQYEQLPVEGPTELASLAASFNDMAEKLSRARAAERSFLLSVSHELKTPLTAIRGYAEGVAEGALPVDEAVKIIRVEAVRLERLVRDVLELARMQRTDFTVEREPVDLSTVAEDVVQRYASQARGFDVELEAVTNGAAPALGDHDRLLQVVSNLVENALRVTPAGGLVRVEAEPGRVVVEDTGPGLQEDELARAFERFFLFSRYGGSDRSVGTGLGLAIVKELTEGMDGRLEVTSEPGRGTRFVLRLPDAPMPAREPVSA